MKAGILTIAAALFMHSLAAHACEELFEIDTTEAKEYVATLQNREADEFDQIVAFETLSCAKRVALRNIALRYGRTAASPDVRAQVLHMTIFKMPRLVLTFRPGEDMTKAAREFVATSPNWSIEIGTRFPERNCMGLGGAKDCNSYILQIVGNKVQIFYSWHADIRADLELRDDGRLIGWFINTRDKGVGQIPVEIVMQ